VGAAGRGLHRRDVGEPLTRAFGFTSLIPKLQIFSLLHTNGVFVL
jgi:hypothetical protein